MITGFNTDIEYEGITYHVQTEDKGLHNPLILSLIYVGGAIIASKRAPYEDLVAAGFDENLLSERLQRQHKLICAAIKAGRIEDLKRMGQREANDSQSAAPLPVAAEREGISNAEAVKTEAEEQRELPEPQTIESETVVEAKEAVPLDIQESKPELEIIRAPIEIVPIETPKPPAREAPPELITRQHGSVIEELKVFDRKAAAPQPPAPVRRERPSPRPVAVESEQDGLILGLRHQSELRSGMEATLLLSVSRAEKSGARRPVPNAPIVVKILGTAFRPVILKTQTDGQGSAIVQTRIPTFTAGRAALLIETKVGGDEVALRRIIRQS